LITRLIGFALNFTQSFHYTERVESQGSREGEWAEEGKREGEVEDRGSGKASKLIKLSWRGEGHVLAGEGISWRRSV
jgi:hypothetical protein